MSQVIADYCGKEHRRHLRRRSHQLFRMDFKAGHPRRSQKCKMWRRNICRKYALEPLFKSEKPPRAESTAARESGTVYQRNVAELKKRTNRTTKIPLSTREIDSYFDIHSQILMTKVATLNDTTRMNLEV